MAYNYYQQPMGYAPMYQNQYAQMQGQPTQQQMQQMQPPAPGIIWVDGYTEAAMYPIAPNAAVALWDKNAACIYVKKADATGKPMMQIFDLVERKETPKPAQSGNSGADMGEFATKTDLRAVSDAVEVLRQGFDEMRLKIASGASDEGGEK